MNYLDILLDKNEQMELQNEIFKMLHKREFKPDFKINFNATEDIIKFIEDKLCQN